MPVFVSLNVGDIRRSVDWYTEAVGFRAVCAAPAGPEGAVFMVHLRCERYQDILLFLGQPGPSDPGRGVTINLMAGAASVEALAERCRGAGTAVVEGPMERQWNVRELTVSDPDGYRLQFTEPVDVTRSFDDVERQMRGEGDR